MHASELARAQRQYLQQINDRLTRIERHAKKEALSLITTLEARVYDPADWLSDYEMELEVTFWLREDDRAFKEDDDNILATLNASLKRLRHPEDSWGLDDGVNHNIAHSIDGHPMQGECHCWLYHCLYDHTPLRGKTCCVLGTSG